MGDRGSMKVALSSIMQIKGFRAHANLSGEPAGCIDRRRQGSSEKKASSFIKSTCLEEQTHLS